MGFFISSHNYGTILISVREVDGNFAFAKAKLPPTLKDKLILESKV
ncbi:hypothetical protein JCM19294_433 [Nonlabens tegetincola]|uniref:Uncharacterized protein n=1 Tax=Nonlabens tegetincola TaxID=323273 RepID=A0A090Q465_9FLAO|nr:hypothetical protein JCM19294_433 [Nonlabens tegetincola]